MNLLIVSIRKLVDYGRLSKHSKQGKAFEWRFKYSGNIYIQNTHLGHLWGF